jgi:DUF971 family protein
MGGLSKDSPIPTEIKLHQQSRMLEVAFDDGQRFEMSCEFLRTHSPSAEVRGHGVGQERLQAGKREVTITKIEPVGSYAIKLTFSDGHDSGIYSWDCLYELGTNRDSLWADYLAKLAAAGLSRDAADNPAPPAKGCGHHH